MTLTANHGNPPWQRRRPASKCLTRHNCPSRRHGRHPWRRLPSQARRAIRPTGESQAQCQRRLLRHRRRPKRRCSPSPVAGVPRRQQRRQPLRHAASGSSATIANRAHRLLRHRPRRHNARLNRRSRHHKSRRQGRQHKGRRRGLLSPESPHPRKPFDRHRPRRKQSNPHRSPRQDKPNPIGRSRYPHHRRLTLPSPSPSHRK
jgi:hypothetical protein